MNKFLKPYKASLRGGAPYTGSNPITPSTKDIVIPKNTLIKDGLTIKGDTDLIASNIKKGINLFGVSGSLTEGTKFAKGTITTNESIASGDTFTNVITINHNLGVTPTFVLVVMYGGFWTIKTDDYLTNYYNLISASLDGYQYIQTTSAGGYIPGYQIYNAAPPRGWSCFDIIANKNTIYINYRHIQNEIATVPQATYQWFAIA